MKPINYILSLLAIQVCLFAGNTTAQESLGVADMPEAFFQNWQNDRGLWWYDVRPEFFGLDNKVWAYESISRTDGVYTVRLRNAFGQSTTLTFSNIREDRMSTSNHHNGKPFTVGPKPYDISFRVLTAAELPPEFYGTWASDYGQGETVVINQNGIRVQDGKWKLHQILWEAGRYRIYLRNGERYLLWIPHLVQNDRLTGVFNHQVQLIRQE